MRLLMAAAPAAGHVLPMVPLAWALRSAGHDVLLTTAGGGVELAASAGLLTVAVAPGVDMVAAGVPQVVVPQGADQFANAAAIDRLGAGGRADADPDAVRAAVRCAVAGEFDAVADRLRRENEQQPTPSAVADALVTMVGGR